MPNILTRALGQSNPNDLQPVNTIMDSTGRIIPIGDSSFQQPMNTIRTSGGEFLNAGGGRQATPYQFQSVNVPRQNFDTSNPIDVFGKRGYLQANGSVIGQNPDGSTWTTTFQSPEDQKAQDAQLKRQLLEAQLKKALNPSQTSSGWSFMQSQDGKTTYRVNPNIGVVQKQVNGGWEVDPTANIGELTRAGGQSGFGSSMNKRFVNRVSGAANEGAAALLSISGMNNPSSGLFSAGAMSGGEGKNIMAGVMSPEGAKQYNATIAGLAPEIAAAQNQGMVPNEEQIRAVNQALSISPTDSLQTKQYRIALGARYLRKALEVSSDLASPDQKNTIAKITKQLSVFPDPDEILGNRQSQGVFGGNQSVSSPPYTNAKGWTLHKDAQGNMAYVSPDGTQFEGVQ